MTPLEATNSQKMMDVTDAIDQKWLRIRRDNPPIVIQHHYPFGYDEFRAREWRDIIESMLHNGAKSAFHESLKQLGIFNPEINNRLTVPNEMPGRKQHAAVDEEL